MIGAGDHKNSVKEMRQGGTCRPEEKKLVIKNTGEGIRAMKEDSTVFGLAADDRVIRTTREGYFSRGG